MRSGAAGAGGGAGVWPADAVAALASLNAALDFLAHDDPARWSEGLQADCLRAMAQAESRQVAAHARVLSAFSVPGGGLAGDGHRSPRMWLSWQTQATRRAAAARVAWMRRLGRHPQIAAALAAASISESWARQIIEWSDRLPEEHRDDADGELLAAMGLGADLPGLARLAEDLRREHAAPDDDDGDGFDDRGLRLGRTFEGAGRMEGNLTPRCAQAAEAVLDALSQKRGPEDDRTREQRQHDALEEAFIRLIGAGTLPQRGGQPVRLELDISLAELVNGDADGMTCDGAVQPVISGMADYGLLEKLRDPDSPQAQALRDAAAKAAATAAAAPFGDVLDTAVRLLSGPQGYAMMLRRKITGIPLTSISLPLDIASVFDTIPVHLRRAVRRRDRHCRFPGCDLPAAGCDVHHLLPRSKGGPHALTNMLLLCWYHHHVAIHRSGWTLTLHADGTTTAVSPDGSKTLRSHPPPTLAA